LRTSHTSHLGKGTMDSRSLQAAEAKGSELCEVIFDGGSELCDEM